MMTGADIVVVCGLNFQDTLRVNLDADEALA